MYLIGGKKNYIYKMKPNSWMSSEFYTVNPGAYYTEDLVNKEQIKLDNNNLYFYGNGYKFSDGNKTYIIDKFYYNMYSSEDNINFTLEQWKYFPSIDLAVFITDVPYSLPFVHDNKILYVSDSTPNKKNDLVVLENNVPTVYEKVFTSDEEKNFFYSDILQSYVICTNIVSTSNYYANLVLTKDFSEFTDLLTYLRTTGIAVNSLISNYIYEFNGYFIVMYSNSGEQGIIYTQDGNNWSMKKLAGLNDPDTKIFFSLNGVTRYKVINNKLYLIIGSEKIFVLDENLDITNISLPIVNSQNYINFVNNDIYLISPSRVIVDGSTTITFTYTTYKYDGNWSLVDDLCFNSVNRYDNFGICDNIIYFA